MANFKPNKRRLEDRSYLTFEFPQTNSRSLRAYLPMLENCEISESKKSNLGEYQLLSRANSLYSYGGARSRSFSLKFNITLLHILDHITKEGLDDRFTRHFSLFFNDKESAKKAFFILQSMNPIGVGMLLTPDNKTGPGMEHGKIHREYYQRIANIRSNDDPNIFDLGINEILSFLGNPVQSNDARYAELNKIIDLSIYWINLIRSTVNNNAKNSTLGPPSVRLVHGPMYNNIPCVVESYSIRINDQAGFDVQTLFPKQIEITMALSENRVGNFEDFAAGQFVDKDNNAGWEAIIESNNSDPYGDLIDGKL